ncbi:MAG: 30S ribosomal protein S11 [Candidatus Doudnabacteria bacterium]|nr:30S ribosomal protein S11 [Candidatus Doudnabacteria bacterium]
MEDITQQTDTVEEKAPVVDAASKIKGARKKKAKAKVTKGKVYINSTYNNTIISVTDPVGNVLAWGSSGKTGFKGSKKSTPYAGQRTMEDLISRVKERGLVEVDVLIKGVGSGRESAIRALQGSGMTVLTIKDQTPVAHGGVRQKKVRRI